MLGDRPSLPSRNGSTGAWRRASSGASLRLEGYVILHHFSFIYLHIKLELMAWLSWNLTGCSAVLLQNSLSSFKTLRHFTETIHPYISMYVSFIIAVIFGSKVSWISNGVVFTATCQKLLSTRQDKHHVWRHIEANDRTLVRIISPYLNPLCAELETAGRKLALLIQWSYISLKTDIIICQLCNHWTFHLKQAVTIYQLYDHWQHCRLS